MTLDDLARIYEGAATPYHDETHAVSARERMKQLYPDSAHLFRSYRCPHCDLWHVGRDKKGG